MFSDIQLGVRDLARMQQFYDAVLAELGLMRVPDHGAGEAGVIWQRVDRRWPQFVLRDPRNGLPATWANGSQVSFVAPSPDAAATMTGSDATPRLVNGEMTFDRDAVAKAIRKRIARPLGLTVEDAASGTTTSRQRAGR